VHYETVLYIDAGNTNLKWWLVHHGKTAQNGVVPSKADVVDELVDHLMLAVSKLGLNIQCVYIASVKSCGFTHYLSGQLADGLGVDIYAVEVVPTLAGLTIAYSEPQSLGVDRWLGMCAAHLAATGYAVYISAGSAITVDVVDINGQHLGGYIAPGAGMQRSMLNSTDKSATQSRCLTGSLEFGCSTQSCVDNGVSVMLSGFINQLISSVLLLPDITELGLDVCVSGGDADFIMSLLCGDTRIAFDTCRVSLYPDAVLQGLKNMCSYHESLSLLSGS